MIFCLAVMITSAKLQMCVKIGTLFWMVLWMILKKSIDVTAGTVILWNHFRIPQTQPTIYEGWNHYFAVSNFL